MPVHPVLACVAAVQAALKDVADVDPAFMPTAAKRAALLGLSTVVDRLEELRLRLLAASDDVAEQVAARDAAGWLAHHGRRERAETRRRLRLARALADRWHAVAAALREGTVNLAQAEVIVHALDALPDHLDPGLVAQAQARLVAEAGEFGPLELRVLGRRVLDVLAPEVAEAHERRLLEREQAHAEKTTFLTGRRRGDGTTDLRGRVADAVADRLFTYLEAFTSPRRPDRRPEKKQPDPATGQGLAPGGGAPGDRRPYDQRLGHAFAAFLETIDPTRLPVHGGDATTVIVQIDLADLIAGLAERAGVGWAGDTPITAGEARRLACTAHLIPAVLGGASEVLDLGRARRLFTPAQRKALAIRDRCCRAQGCDIPAAWCEAHHAGTPWAHGGKTDLADGLLLCSWHHHRAHDHRYTTTRTPNGDLTYHRRL